MGKAKTKGKQRLDKFYHLAKEQGYRSRAAFKLIQLDAKFRFLPSARSVLDLCAAPGGWLQVAVRHAPAGSFVLGVDLFPIRPIRGAHSIVEDITTTRCRASVKRLMDSNGCPAFEAVLHDGSPNVGGAWAQEATTQSSLVVDALRLATEFLAPKGTFVTKVFRSQDYSAVLYCLKQLFEKVEVTKPVASRSTSAEIYVVGLRYKAPAKIDPRLLDVKHLFQGANEPSKIVDVLRGSKQKRNREGYEDGNTTLRKVGLASDFVWSETPLEVLGSVNSISFGDPSCSDIKAHDTTTEEVITLFEDLRVLDKHSFKHLLKWRLRIRKALSPAQKGDAKIADTVEKAEENEDDRMLNEMEELTNALERKRKRQKKMAAKRRAKDKSRKATGMQIDATEDSYFDRDLFSLSAIKGKKDLAALESSSFNDEDDEFKDADDGDVLLTKAKESSSDVDSEEERMRYENELDKLFDQAYDSFIERRGGSTKKATKCARRRLSDGNMELDADEYEPRSDDDSDSGKHDDEINPLMVSLEEEQPTAEEIAEKWFSQDVFADVMVEGNLANSDSEDELVKETEEKEKVQKSQNLIPNQSKTKCIAVEKQALPQDDFEIVPAETDTSDDSEDYDDDSKAEILAYAKKMLRKKVRENILDDAYNKYTYDDEGLPKWFIEEERRHRQLMKPVSKEEVAAMKAQFRAIDARPAKKVAEAKARKKRIAMKRMEKARKKATSISDQADISDRSKRKMIDQVYKKAVPKKPKKELVVAKKGVQVRAGKGKVLVDRRMKKDLRSRGSGTHGKKGKSGKGKAKSKSGGLGKKGKSRRN